jgi:hypothetical protein
MTRQRRPLVAVVVIVLLLAACATPPRAQRVGHWSYVDTTLDPFWWTELIDVKGAHGKGVTGKQTTVAIVGTGVLKGHEDLTTILPGAATCGTNPDNTEDRNGHGTQLAGIAVGRNDAKSISTRGVAPDAGLIPIKVDCGVVSAESLTKGVDAAIARRPDVILIAIGGYPAGAPDVHAFMTDRVLRNPGILFVVASVWDGTQYAFPAWTQADNALLVAAMTQDADPGARERVTRKEIPYTARRGDIWAPGRNVGTADIEPKPGGGHEQFLMNGTSPAAAATAGCALLVRGKTGQTGSALKRVLLAAAEPQPDLGAAPRNGRLDCARALP